MDDSRDSRDSYGSGAQSSGPTAVRRACVVIAAIMGGIAGGLLVVPLWIIAPYWLFVTLPLLMGAVYASSMAYLVAGPVRTTLSRTMIRSLVAATACALVNLALFAGLVPGIVPTDDLALPGGQATNLLEAMVIGAVAGVVATRGSRGRRTERPPLWTAVFISAVAIATLLVIGSSILPVLFNA